MFGEKVFHRFHSVSLMQEPRRFIRSSSEFRAGDKEPTAVRQAMAAWISRAFRARGRMPASRDWLRRESGRELPASPSPARFACCGRDSDGGPMVGCGKGALGRGYRQRGRTQVLLTGSLVASPRKAFAETRRRPIRADPVSPMGVFRMSRGLFGFTLDQYL